MRPRAWFVVFGFLALIFGPSALSLAGAQTLPAGTIVNVRTTQPITADFAQVGMRLDGVVDDPVRVHGRTVVQRGAVAALEIVRVDRSSNMKGRDRIGFQLRSLRVGGRSVPVTTSDVEFRGRSEGRRATRRIAGGAGVGAIVGGVLGGGTGAALGATAGGATGAIVTGSGKQHLSVPAETRLQFRLTSATAIQR